jgi:uncharacterized protein
MTGAEAITGYRQNLGTILDDMHRSAAVSTPLGDVCSDIIEMVHSYLADAAVFHTSGDLVNEYASLAYLHGWVDAARYLGYITTGELAILLPDDTFFPDSEQEKLREKACRYHRMLSEAVISVEIAPVSGSPLYQASAYMEEKARYSALHTIPDPLTGYGHALGELSYWYGWLDTGVRAGLFRITGDPHLFTTEP